MFSAQRLQAKQGRHYKPNSSRRRRKAFFRAGLGFGGIKKSTKQICRAVVGIQGSLVPWFFLLDRKMRRVPDDCPYPLLVKPRFGDSSEGLTTQSIVHNVRAPCYGKRSRFMASRNIQKD